MSERPSEDEVMMEFGAKAITFVPPLATGRVPVTCEVREICPPSVPSPRQVEDNA